ncbi:MAG: hypothetical protein AAFP78_08140, partial [Pseudomonadota bacterium]
MTAPLPEETQTRLLMIAVAAVVGAQVVLVFAKPINWDEFLHFSQVADLAEGRLHWRLQTLHARVFAYALAAPGDAIDQIRAARLGALAFSVATTAMVILLASRFADRRIAWLCGLAYIAGGYVFVHAFALRPDPAATAALMAALCLMAFGRLSAPRLVAAGVLIGLAGALTIKSVFFLPCFAGIAWMRAAETPDDRWPRLALIAIVPVVAMAAFAALIAWHGADATGGEGKTDGLARRIGAFVLEAPLQNVRYGLIQLVLTPLATVGVIASLAFLRRLDGSERVAVIGLLAPLATLLFFRNTFPYYFVFLYAPLCVAIAPGLAQLRGRIARAATIPAAVFGAVVLASAQTPSILSEQRALLNEVNRLFPETAGYVAHVPFAPRHGRVLPHFLSGPGLERYAARGAAVIAERVEAGDAAFALAD